MAKKVYAVRKGKTTGIFYTWSACSDAVNGYPGAEFKGFATEAQARAYLEGETLEEIPLEAVSEVKKYKGKSVSKKVAVEDIEPVMEEIAENQVIAYVDGSFDQTLEKYSFGCILLTSHGVFKESGNGCEPDSLAIRNVAGEMLGAMFAAQWALVNGYERIELRYDYEGIEKWATGAWKANNALTQKYAAFMQRKQSQIRITFQKVKAHSGDYYNEQVDKLAKTALTEADGIPRVQRMDDEKRS